MKRTLETERERRDGAVGNGPQTRAKTRATGPTTLTFFFTAAYTQVEKSSVLAASGA